MDIYLTDLETNDRLWFPMLPEQISLKYGTLFQEYTVLDPGEIKIPAGDKLAGISWNGTFPGASRRNAPYVREWVNPTGIIQRINNLRGKRKKLRLLVTESPINLDVYIERFDVEMSGGYGDYTYSISFIQARGLTVQLSSPGSNASASTRPSPPPSSTYTIVNGDTLWAIAQRRMGAGSKYSQLYEANKDAIEAEAKRRGLSSSSKGHWIFAGTVLRIP